VHFADTMRGGQYLNNWRMAEIHAREAPDRVRELERGVPSSIVRRSTDAFRAAQLQPPDPATHHAVSRLNRPAMRVRVRPGSDTLALRRHRVQTEGYQLSASPPIVVITYSASARGVIV